MRHGRQFGWWAVSSIAVAILLIGCRAPAVRFEHLSDLQLVQRSPVIVIGVVEKVQEFREERVMHASAGPFYRVSVRTTVENVLRGTVQGPSLEYSYWLPVGPRVGEWHDASVGTREVHFLRWDGGQLRSLVDFWPSTLRVTTGVHATLAKDVGMAETVARVLLVPEGPTERLDLNYGVWRSSGVDRGGGGIDDCERSGEERGSDGPESGLCYFATLPSRRLLHGGTVG